MVELEITNGRVSISGASTRVMNAIEEVSSYKVAGYFWAPAYKNGYWDGREHLLRMDRRTRLYGAPIGLLDDILDVLKDSKKPFTVNDKRTDREPIVTAWDPNTKLRRYQLKAIKSVWNGGIINMPIRSGKTKTAAALIALTKRSTIFIVPSKQLLHQTHAALTEALGITVGMIGDSEWSLEDVTVASIQTLSRMNNTTEAAAKTAAQERWPKVLSTINKNRRAKSLPRLDEDKEEAERKAYIKEARERAREVVARWASLRDRFSMLIMDECHHLTADDWQKAVFSLNCRWRVGLSATAYPDRKKEQAKGVIWLRAICGPLRTVISMSELIEQGYLCPTRIIWHEITTPPMRNARWSQRLTQDCITCNPLRNRTIIDYAVKYAADGHRVLIVCGRLDQVDRLYQLAGLRGLRANVVTGQGDDVDIAVRSAKIKQLIDGSVPVIIGTVFGEGVDIPEVDVVINAEGGQDDISTVQRLRCLTKVPGKELAIVVDFNDRMNKYFEKHSRARLRVYRSESAFEIVEVK